MYVEIVFSDDFVIDYLPTEFLLADNGYVLRYRRADGKVKDSLIESKYVKSFTVKNS